MNERIFELAEQAVQLIANEHTKGDVSRLNTDAYHVKDLIREKFAELIVSDAIAKIESVGFKSSNDIPFEITDLFISQIKQHFGVEE